MARAALTFALLAATAALLVAAPSAGAKRRHVVVGISEQSTLAFPDKRFAKTGIRTMRLVVPYNVVRRGGTGLKYTDSWLQAARAADVQPLVSFTKRVRRGLRHLPSTREYMRNVRAFRKRYPWVRIFATWNEANLTKTQPTGRHPIQAARFYRALRRNCRRRCKVLSPEFLATGTRAATNWLLTFARHDGRGPHIWAVHTYPDANRFRVFRTQKFLRTVPRGQVWITETGGIVKFHRFHRSSRRASRAVRHSFELARMSGRIKRLYIYNWRHAPWEHAWDSGLLTSGGRARPALRTVMRFVRHSRLFKTRKPRRTPYVRPLEPVEQ
jgi:hypothetical protein